MIITRSPIKNKNKTKTIANPRLTIDFFSEKSEIALSEENTQIIWAKFQSIRFYQARDLVHLISISQYLSYTFFIMTKVIWLVSYPKSGNTWMRFLLANLIYGIQEDISELEYLIPDIHNGLDNHHFFWRDSLIIKTHLKCNKNFETFNHLLASTVGFIYLVRNPIDIMLSNWNYLLLTSNLLKKLVDNGEIDKIDHIFAEYIDKFIYYKGYLGWIDVGIGNLEENFNSWLDHNLYQFPHMIMSYENLISNTYLETTKVCNFLDLQVSEKQIKQSIKNSCYVKMKRMEEKAIQRQDQNTFYNHDYEYSYSLGIRFMNKRNTQKWREKLTQEQLNNAYDNFSVLINKFKILT